MNNWPEILPEYIKRVNDPTTDTHHLKAAIVPKLLKLMGDKGPVLGIGCGDGLLHKHFLRVYSCDVVDNKNIPNFSIQDIRSLNYPRDSFGGVLANFVMMWANNLRGQFESVYNVTEAGGVFVFTIVHPLNYCGELINGNYIIDIPYGLEGCWNQRIANVLGPCTYHHRPISTYLQEAINAGWVLEYIEEETLDVTAFNKLGLKPAKPRHNLVPLSVIVKLRKPAFGPLA